MAYLDKAGLTHLYSKLKDIFALKSSIGDATLTIKKNGTSIGTFKANASSDVEVNIEADAQVQSDWDEADASQIDYIKNKPELFSGSYNDLSNKPTLGSASTLNYTWDSETGVLTFTEAE